MCTAGHAIEAADRLAQAIEKMRAGQRQTIVVGTGHGTCTCEGAAFEYAFNVEHELRQAGVRDMADLVYLTNEYELGDFGVGGMVFTQKGFQTTSKTWTESLFRERGMRAILGAHVEKVEPGVISYEQLDGSKHTLDFDFAMLLPPFRGADLKAYDAQGEDITAELFAPSGLMKVDADYTAKPFEEWRAEDWPQTYQTPAYANVFAVGIAFAPPHQISRPRTSPNGTLIAPAPPRTGMPSGVMGKVVAENIVEMIGDGSTTPKHTASMARMGAACIASAGAGLRKGTAAAMTMYPIVPDYQKYPESGGRSPKDTYGEIGLGAHWIKTRAALHVHLQGQGQAGLVPHPRVTTATPTADPALDSPKDSHGQRRSQHRPSAAADREDGQEPDEPGSPGRALRGHQHPHGQDDPQGPQLTRLWRATSPRRIPRPTRNARTPGASP